MTPQERQLINELFSRLAPLENSPRDPDAEAMIREGLRRAPNAVYSLVQTVLVQDEALKAANARIQDYEGQGAGPEQPPEQSRSFLDSMREGLFGRDEQRGSAPRVPQGAPMGAPQGYRNDPWGQGPGQGYAGQGYQAAPQSGGGSFLGTAAAAAAGMIGGSLLMGGIRSAMGGHQGGGPFAGAFDSLSRGGESRSPFGGNAAGSDLSRQAGLNDVGGQKQAFGGDDQSHRAGLFDASDNNSDDDSDFDDSADDSFDGGDSDSA